MSRENRPNTLWPVGTTVEFVDAWGKNPVIGKVIRLINTAEILIEDNFGVRYCGQTWRVQSEPIADRAAKDSTVDSQFKDLLG